MMFVAEHFDKIKTETNVCNLIQAREKDGAINERLENLRKKIHEDYDGVDLCDEVHPDPPERGMYGYAYINLKENAIPQRQKPFYQHGERYEAMKKNHTILGGQKIH